MSCLAACLVLLVAIGPGAAAARKPITGKLSRPGYTVIALPGDGRATAARASRGTFRIRPRAQSVTLHLRAPGGVYAGPIVIRGEGRRAILGVEAGARLGKINVRPGYARLARRLAGRWVAGVFTARARRSVPIGARVFGRVRSKPPRTAVPGDRDRDGIPNPLDIDDDGDLILDNLDRSRKARAAQSSQPSGEFFLASWLDRALDETVNANAPNLTDPQIEAALPSYGDLGIEILPGDSAELDCGRPQSRADPGVGGLVYCSPGGTGRIANYPTDPSTWPPFPGSRGGPFDPDSDGFGTLTQQPDLPPGDSAMFLRHGATSAQIGSGDVLIQRVTTDGTERQFPATLQYVFATAPALVSYSDGQGNSATVSYPVAGHPGPGCGPPPGCSGPDPGIRGNGFPVKAGPNGDVVLTLTFWRPQRRPISGEPGYSDPPSAWIDIGGLNYRATVADKDPGEFSCEQTAFPPPHPNLTPTDPTPEPGGGGFRDQAVDQPASPANTFTYTLNMTRCLSSKGFSFEPGEERGMGFAAVVPNGIDTAGVSVFFKRQ